MSLIVFDSWEAMAEFERKTQEELREFISDWQMEVRPGDYVLSLGRSNVLVFGEIIEGDDTMEDYVYGRWYSIYCVEGELGDKHRATLSAKIKKDTFEKFKEKGFVL